MKISSYKEEIAFVWSDVSLIVNRASRDCFSDEPLRQPRILKPRSSITVSIGLSEEIRERFSRIVRMNK